MIYDIIQELNAENGSNYKKDVLTKYKDNETLKQVLKLAYDKVQYTFGISMKNVPEYTCRNEITLEEGLDALELLADRTHTGNSAINFLTEQLSKLSEEDAKVMELIINRDLRINMGKSNINKIIKNLITKPPYMRCSLADKLDRITYPAVVQLKADGTYRSLIVDNGEVTLMSRAGEQDDYPNFFEKVSKLPDGVYIGELLLKSCSKASDRLKANGLINSKREQDDMYLQCWDYLTLDEWNVKASKVEYVSRFGNLVLNVKTDAIEIIDGKEVDSYEEAMEYYKGKVAEGFEGAVLKNKNTPFKDHTSPTQIKLKEEAVAEFVITGYEEGKGRLEGTLGAMFYKSGDEMVQGKMGGFNDATRKEIWENQDEYLGKIVSVKYNGVTKGKGKDTFALMFANFVEVRNDKDTADDLEYIQNALK